MKKIIFLILVLSLLLAGCGNVETQAEIEILPPEQTSTASTEAAVESNTADQPEASTEEQTEPAVTVYPLPDTTMDNLNDAILSVSLEEGKAYVDDTGKMQMDLKIYSYDKYDMVDVSLLKVGDILVTAAGEVKINSLERRDDGSIAINGGMQENGFDLITDDCGIFYERGYNDAKNWHEVGEATIRVSADFIYHDNSDLDKGEVVYYPGSFLVGEVTDYHFTPHNTTIRVENGQIVEMHRVYIP